MSSLKQTPQSETLYRTLREAILTLALPPGQVLRKAELQAVHGGSRFPLDRALARLAAEGLVQVVPQSGSRVAALDLPRLRESAFLREAIETAAVARVAAAVPEGLAEALERNLRLQRFLVQESDFAEFYRADEGFHLLILQATGLRGVAAAVEGLAVHLQRARRLLLPSPGRAAETLAEHEAIARALLRGEAEAAREAMARHLQRVLARLEALAAAEPGLFGQGR